MSERFFLAQDDDCHWYIVPVVRRAEWQEWRDSENEDVPSWAYETDGPHRVTFTNPENQS